MQPGAGCKGEQDGAGDDAGDGQGHGALGVAPGLEKASQFLDVLAGLFVMKADIRQSTPQVRALFLLGRIDEIGGGEGADLLQEMLDGLGTERRGDRGICTAPERVIIEAVTS
jgi:hypothetical protein